MQTNKGPRTAASHNEKLRQLATSTTAVLLYVFLVLLALLVGVYMVSEGNNLWGMSHKKGQASRYLISDVCGAKLGETISYSGDRCQQAAVDAVINIDWMCKSEVAMAGLKWVASFPLFVASACGAFIETTVLPILRSSAFGLTICLLLLIVGVWIYRHIAPSGHHKGLQDAVPFGSQNRV